MNHQDKKVPISFKIKYTPGKKGAHPKISIIQICLNTEVCYLFHVFYIRELWENGVIPFVGTTGTWKLADLANYRVNILISWPLKVIS